MVALASALNPEIRVAAATEIGELDGVVSAEIITGPGAELPALKRLLAATVVFDDDEAAALAVELCRPGRPVARPEAEADERHAAFRGEASDFEREELERLIGRIRRRWPQTRIIVRGDSGFCRG